MDPELDFDAIRADLIGDEGLRSAPYRCTSGKLTIGVGRNLDDVGISQDEALYLLDNDINGAVAELDRVWPWWRDLMHPAQRALVNMMFNLGALRFGQFRKMLAALETEDYSTAAEEALNSKWAAQVGDRAERIADLFRRCAPDGGIIG